MRLRGFLTLALIGLFLAPATGFAQQPMEQPANPGPPLTVKGEGTEVFRALLNLANIKPVTERELFNPLQFDNIILIVLGSPNPPGNSRISPLHHLSPASARGGVLIATDSLLQVESTKGHRLEISGDRVECLNANAIHLQESGCPYVVPLIDTSNKPTSQLFQGLNRIAANSSSYITVDGWGGDCQLPLAIFPRNCTYGAFKRPLPRTAYFAVGGEGPEVDGNPHPYRFLMVADHSIFINQMLLEPGTENLELASRMIEYLQGPNKRNRCIFYENGQLIDHFDDLGREFARQNQLPIPQINMGAMQEWLVTQGNRLLDSVQQDDVMNRAVTRGVGVPAIARFFLILAAILACWFVLRRTWGTRKPTDTPPPPAVAGAPSGPPGVFERRQKELLRRNNVYEPVRDLVREFFVTFGLHGEQGPKHPKLVISDAVRKPDSLRAAIKDLWRLAYGPPQVLTVNRWRELEPFFERVRLAHADGKWRFVLSEATAGSVV